MANKYCNLDGTKKISVDYPKISAGFELVEVDINAVNIKVGANLLENKAYADDKVKIVADDLIELDDRVDTIITTPVTDISVQEIVDARQGELSLGANLIGVKSQLSDIVINVNNYKFLIPNIEDIELEWDWTIPILTAIAEASIGSKVVIPKKSTSYRTTATILVDKAIELVMYGIINADHSGIAIEIRNSGLGSTFIPSHRLSAKRKNINHADLSSIGIKIVNCYATRFRIDYLKDFTEGLQLVADDSKGCVYNEISLGMFHNNKTQIRLFGLGGEAGNNWVNQNVFIGGRLYYGSLVDRVGFVQIQIDGGDIYYRANGNTFINTSIEDIGVGGVYAKAIVCNGTNNAFIAVRVEGSKAIEIGVGANYNEIIGGTYIGLSDVVDSGSFNQVSTRSSGARFSAQANGHAFKGTSPSFAPLKAYNTSTSNPSIQVMDSTGEEVRISICANGEWNVYKNRKVLFGIYVAAPTVGLYNRGDISFVVNPASGSPIGYICTAGDGTTLGTWVPFGGRATTQADSTAVDVATLKTDFNSLITKLKNAGIMA